MIVIQSQINTNTATLEIVSPFLIGFITPIFFQWRTESNERLDKYIEWTKERSESFCKEVQTTRESKIIELIPSEEIAK